LLITVVNNPVVLSGKIIKIQHLKIGNFALGVYYMPHNLLRGLVEVKSVQAGTHRVRHGFFI